MRVAREVNDGKPEWVMAKVRAAAAKVPNPVVACLGLAFKANIDDLRESPSLEIAAHLAGEGFKVLAVEPHVTELPKVLQGKATFATLDDALAAAQIIVLLVDHTAFKTVAPSRLSGKQVIDTRGIWTS